MIQRGKGVIPSDLNHNLPFRDAAFDVIYCSHVLEHFSKRHAPIFLKECHRVLRAGGLIRIVVPDFERLASQYLELLNKSLDQDAEAQRRYEWITIEMLDQMVRNEPGGEMLRYWAQDPMPEEEFVAERIGSELKEGLRFLKAPGSRELLESLRCDDLPTQPPDLLALGRFRVSGETHRWMYDRYSLSTLLTKSGFEDVRVCNADQSSVIDFNSYFLDVEPGGNVRKPDSLFMEAIRP